MGAPAATIGFLSCGTASGSSPTLDVQIQHSIDNTNWISLYTFTQVTASNAVLYAVPTTFNTPVLPYVRFYATVGGSGGPSFASVVCYLLCQYISRQTVFA